eukprot:1142018-Pelagomonas_calceolata.AAC.2
MWQLQLLCAGLCCALDPPAGGFPRGRWHAKLSASVADPRAQLAHKRLHLRGNVLVFFVGAAHACKCGARTCRGALAHALYTKRISEVCVSKQRRKHSWCRWLYSVD